MILTPGVDELVGQLLGRGGRDGEHADDDVLLLDDLAQVVGMADGRGPDLLADLARVGVEDRDDAEAVVGEDVRARRSPCRGGPAPNSAMLCWPLVRRILRICETSESTL